MKMIRITLLAVATVCAGPTIAGDLTLDAAIGGAVGGAVGGALGAELGGRDGAIAGAGLGAAAGAAINTTDSNDRHHRRGDRDRYENHHDYGSGGAHPHGSRFCPPGQAKKGRC